MAMPRSVFRPGWRFVFLMLCFGLETGNGSAAETSVKLVQRSPVESLAGTGEITGVRMAAAGTACTLVAVEGDRVQVKDAAGNLYRLVLAATDYVPPPPTATNAAPGAVASPTNAPPAAPAEATATATNAAPPATENPAPPPSPAPAPVASNATTATVNAAFGKTIFDDQPLWQATALLLAQRLGLGLEGRTKWESSYRRYFSGQADDPKSQVLGVGAYCVAIYADADDHPTSLLIAFANAGDFRGVGRIAAELSDLENSDTKSQADAEKRRVALRDKYMEMETTFEPTRKAEEATLTDRLTQLFGDGVQTVFGSDATTKEKTVRWDWNGASFLLTCLPSHYNLLRIVPTALADNNGRTERIPRDDIGRKLSEAVEHRPNGDVIITQIPMADQGPKGYCVPATWERVLRYTGVPGDMYTLSRIGSANFGGGEQGLKIAKELDATLDAYGRHVVELHPTKLDYLAFRHYIDDGVPVFWGVNPKGYDEPLERYALLDRSKDWDQWKTLLDQARATEAADKKPLPEDQGHQVLIIGYNPDTRELAWSDPWGRSTGERWMTQEEAVRCSLDEFYIITW